MKIGIDARLWNETGVGRYIRNLVENLLEIDKTNKYVLFVLKKNYQEIKHLIDNSRSANWKLVIADISWHSFREQFEFAAVLNKENLNLIHFPYFSHPVIYNKPFIITIHDLIIHHFPTGKASTLSFPLYYLKHQGYKYVLSHAVNQSKKIIVPLKTVKKDLQNIYPLIGKKIHVTYEGTDLKIKNYGNTQSLPGIEPFFLYVGNAYPHKNLEILIEAFKSFRDENQNIKLLLVGKEDYFYKRLKEKVKKDNAEGVFFKSNVSDSELSNYYSRALALISPSLMEGFGLPPLEAMTVGNLVLLSDIPSFREVCGDIAFYFDPSDKNDIKEKLKFIYHLDNKNRQKLIITGKQRAQLFSWKEMTVETLKIYENCISI